MQEQSQKVVLEAKSRPSIGKNQPAVLRREGRIPGIVYGEGKPTVSVHVVAKELHRILHTKAGGNVLITLQVDGGESAVLVKELQHHPVSHQIVHVDFHRISLTKRITVTVPLVFKGEAVGVKQAGGILEHLRWELEVECLPTEIPAEIAVDVSHLEVGHSLPAKAVLLPSGVRLVTHPELPVVACEIPKVEAVAPAAAEAAAEATPEPEVLKQKKPEEIAAEEEAKAKEKEKEKASGERKG